MTDDDLPDPLRAERNRHHRTRGRRLAAGGAALAAALAIAGTMWFIRHLHSQPPTAANPPPATATATATPTKKNC
ncbi:hypothetical protein, partial [Kribbella solani]|uniref:hypothetical protein n=1 Tax=Kribbella solani TaxID=236067 RepID=UPI0029B577F9